MDLADLKKGWLVWACVNLGLYKSQDILLQA